jgi:hypothetical protein
MEPTLPGLSEIRKKNIFLESAFRRDIAIIFL